MEGICYTLPTDLGTILKLVPYTTTLSEGADLWVQAVLTNNISPTIYCHSASCHATGGYPGHMYLFFTTSPWAHTYSEMCTQQQMYLEVFLNLNNVSVVEANKVCHQRRFVSIFSPNERRSFPEMPNCSKRRLMKLVHCSTSVLS